MVSYNTQRITRSKSRSLKSNVNVRTKLIEISKTKTISKKLVNMASHTKALSQKEHVPERSALVFRQAVSHTRESNLFLAQLLKEVCRRIEVGIHEFDNDISQKVEELITKSNDIVTKKYNLEHWI